MNSARCLTQRMQSSVFTHRVMERLIRLLLSFNPVIAAALFTAWPNDSVYIGVGGFYCGMRNELEKLYINR